MWSQVGLRKHHYKASGDDGIPVELFQILKDDAVKVLHSVCQQIWKTQQWPQNWRRSVFIPIPKKGKAKEWSNCGTIGLISHVSKIMLKILKLCFNSTWTENFQMCKRALEKAEEPEIKWQLLLDHGKINRIPEKYLSLLHWLYQNLWLWGSQQTVEYS